ncbi:hypothetical protein FB567DRAFT_613232 [Paraphoma chrysanthemicola]|uniref:Uncharacterized protein n=1 Tax=Paraphoma chrysanthemicola TaxID=798071 RepID=A0A8K0QSL9_9PLEO|nr:hypothetical protein FB567DRAFT_613232 [Paraphoma chrysanthemicola]
MLFNIATIAVLALGLAQAAPAPANERRADADCPPLAPYLISSDSSSVWNTVCTAYDTTWENTCNRGVGPDPITFSQGPLRSCSDPVWQV